MKKPKYLENLNELINESEIIEIDDMITLYDFYDAENNIMNRIKSINNVKDVVESEKIDKEIVSYEKIIFDENTEEYKEIKNKISDLEKRLWELKEDQRVLNKEFRLFVIIFSFIIILLYSLFIR